MTNSGKPESIKGQGLVIDLPFEKYQQAPGLNQGFLKQHLKPKSQRPPEGHLERVQLRGNAGHCLILERERFLSSYIRAPEGLRRRGANGRQRWEAFVRRNPGRTVLPANLWDQLIESERVLRVHPGAGKWMEEGHPEISMFWEDSEQGIRCKARMDWFNPTYEIILDLKFTGNGNASECRKQISDLHYDLQAAWYCRGIRKIRRTCPRFVILFIEAVVPHRIVPFILTPVELEKGELKIHKALKSALQDRDKHAFS